LVYNLGPQHPSTHGVLRCISILHGEIIQYVITEIGLLHRGTEKLIAINSNPTNISYFDRLDYVSVVTQELLFLQTLEILVGCNITLIVSL
jgi:NADH:ubiquinone oxidoreductase subunit D